MSKEILFFSAPWCGPCNQMKAMFSESIQNEINLKIIDVEEDTDLSTSHQIMNIPTFVILENGVEVSRIIGTTTIDQLRSL